MGKTDTGSEVKKKTYVEFLGFPMVTDVIGKKTLEVDLLGETVKDVIEKLIRLYGKRVRDAFLIKRETLT